MIDVLMQYGLFLAKAVTIVITIAIIIMLGMSLSKRGRPQEKLEVNNLNKKYDSMALALKRSVLPRKHYKQEARAEKARQKAEKKTKKKPEDKKRVFVLNFHGDIKASAVASLREEITTVLTMATPKDEVLVRLENAGGLVHEHGLAASQLLRIKDRKIPLTVAVDKVAASGGYLMACVANKIIAAPFAIVGSIGVLAQLPNFHRLLDKHGVDFEQIKAGEFKRTVTVFGKNTDKERKKLKEEIEDTHELFKNFVAENRPDLDIKRVATGEHWYGTRALELKLINNVQTSDDYLLAASKNADLYEVTYTTKKTLSEKLVANMQSVIDNALLSWWQRAERGPLV
ncbi:MAG: protease SohB [Gammaproteobacteria bacterium]|jgi:serine protease SohB|nr:protease SohB [Gammaproteobacteria bacterium]